MLFFIILIQNILRIFTNTKTLVIISMREILGHEKLKIYKYCEAIYALKPKEFKYNSCFGIDVLC